MNIGSHMDLMDWALGGTAHEWPGTGWITRADAKAHSSSTQGAYHLSSSEHFPSLTRLVE